MGGRGAKRKGKRNKNQIESKKQNETKKSIRKEIKNKRNKEK